MSKERLSRRALLRAGVASAAGLIVAACQPKVVEVEKIVKETVEVEKVVKETVQVEVEKEVTRVVEKAVAGPVEAKQLVFWDQFGQEATGVDVIVAMFNEARDDIVVKRESQTSQTMRDILKTALSAGTGPDIAYYDTGPGFAGILARAGLLLPIDDAYQEFGWNEKVIPWAKERTAFDGHTYGIGHELEFLGVYCNQRIFENEGLSEPKSHDEFIDACETLKGRDYIPIAFANQGGWPAWHMFSIFACNVAGKDKVAAAISGELPWNDPDFVTAIRIFFVDMMKAGYFVPDVNAATYDDGNLLFYNGQAGMSMTGSWMIDGYGNPDNMEDPVGFFYYPSIQGKPIAPPAGLGSGYFISKATSEPYACCQFLDHIAVSKEAAKIWLEDLAKIPPIDVDASEYDISDLLRFCIESLQVYGDNAGYNIDVLTPDTFNTVMGEGFQEVLEGTKSPEQVADDLEEAMKKAKEEGKVMDITP